MGELDQVEEEIEHIILLVSRKNGKLRFISQGSKIRFQLKNNIRTFSGRIESINDSTFTVGGTAYFPQNLSWIKAPTGNLEPTQIGGIALFATGALTAIGGGCLAISSYNSNDPCCAVPGTLAGIGLVTTGVVMATPGGILAFSHPRYDLRGKWIPQISTRVVQP